MTQIQPKTRTQVSDLEPLLQRVEAAMGFVPTSMLTMAHWPELLSAFGGLGGTVLGSGELDSSLKQLVAYVVSNAAGCRYCEAHTSHAAARSGVSEEKIEAAFEYESSDLFSASERAALRMAAHAGMVPNAVEAEHIQALEEFYSPRQIVELVAVISLFGFLNRWNDTLATTLEEAPRRFADTHLKNNGWSAGKHD